MTTHSPVQKRGFNLVEAAIVLGVIGLVIGGIWVAASSVSEKRRVTGMSTAVLQLVQSLRGAMAGQTYPDSSIWLTDLVARGGMLPANWTYNGASIFNDQGHNVNINAPYDTSEFATSAGHGLFINFTDGLSNSDCINLVSAITSRFKDQSDLVYVAIGSASYLRSFPADMATITTNCTTRGGNPAIGFGFRP